MGELGYIGDYIDKDESKNEDINNINQAITEEKENETYSLCSNIKNEIDKIKEIKEKGEINMYVNKIETVSLSKELDKILSNNTTDALEDLICITNGILYNDDIKTITGDEKQKIQTIIGNVFSNPKINSDTVIRYVWKFHCCLSDKKRGIKTESSNNRIEIMNVCYQLAQAKCYAELQSNPQDAKQNLIQLCKILTGRFNGSGQGRENQANKDKIFNNQGLAIAILESLMQINGTIDKIAPIDLLEDESSLKNKECLDFVEDIGKNIPLPLWAEFGLGDFLYFDEEINISKLSSILQSRAIVLKKISEKIKSDKKKALSDFDYEYIEELKKFGAEEAKTQQAKFEIQKDNFKTIIEGKVISDYGDVGNTGILALVYINKTQNAERARNFIPTKEFNLTDIDASIFDLYRDITVDNPDLGYMSDYSNDKKEELNNLIIEGAKMGAMIGGTVLAMVIFPPAGAAGSITLFTLTTSAVAVGVTQGVLTQILYKKLDYDSVGEGVVDIGSQLFFDTATSLIGMKMLGPIKQIRPGLIKDVKNIISNVGITLFDVTVGASAEGVRQMLVNSAFDKQEKVDIMKMIRAGGVMATVFLMVSGGFHVKLPVDDMLRHLKANDPKINPNGFKKLEISEIDYKKSLILLEAKSRSLVDESGSGSSNQQKTNQQKTNQQKTNQQKTNIEDGTVKFNNQVLEAEALFTQLLDNHPKKQKYLQDLKNIQKQNGQITENNAYSIYEKIINSNLDRGTGATPWLQEGSRESGIISKMGDVAGNNFRSLSDLKKTELLNSLREQHISLGLDFTGGNSSKGKSITDILTKFVDEEGNRVFLDEDIIIITRNLMDSGLTGFGDLSGKGGNEISNTTETTNQQKQKINITSEDLIKMDTKLEKLIDTTRNKIKEGTLTQKSKQDMLDEIDIEIKSLDNLQRQGHTNTNANLSNKSQELKLLRQDIEQITIGITPDISVNGKNVELHPDNIDGINSTILNLETQIKYLKKGDSDYEIIFNQLIELRKVQIEIAVYNVFLANNQNLPPTNTNLPPTNTSWNKMSGSTKNRKGVNDNFNKQLYSIISKHEFSINRGKTIQILFDRGILGKISLNDAQRQAIGIPDTIISDMEVTIYVLNKISSSNDMRPTLRLIALASDSSEHITRVVKKYNINNIIDMYIASGGHANFNNSFFEFYSPKLLKLFNEPIYDNGTKISYEAPTIFRKLDTHNTNVTSKIPTEILDELKNVYRNRNITVEQIADPQTKGLDKKTTIIEDKSNTAGYIISQKSYLTIKDNNGIEIGFITRDGTWGRIEVFGSVQQGKTITKGSETYHGYQHFGEIIPRNNYVKQNANANTILDKNTIFFGKNPSGNTNLYISKNTFVGKADGKTYNVIYNVNKGGEYVVHGILESNTDISNIQLNIKNNNIYEQNINTQAIIDFGSITDKTIGCDEAIATYKSHVGASTTLDPNPTQGMNVRFFIK